MQAARKLIFCVSIPLNYFQVMRPVSRSFGSRGMLPAFSNLAEFRVKKFDGHDDEVNCVAFSPDFTRMATGSDDFNVRIFNAENCQLIHNVTGHNGAVRCVAISRDTVYFASGSYDKTIQIRQVSDASLCHMLKGHDKSVEVIMFSPDTKTLCSGSWDRSAILWNVKSGSMIACLVGHGGLVQSLAFSPQGVRIATGSWDFLVRVWCQKGHFLTGKDRILTSTSDNQKEIIPLYTPKPSHILKKHTGNVHSVSFFNDEILASGSWDKTVCVWDLSNNQLLHCLTGHKSWVQAVAFSQDGSHLVSASDDDTIRIWTTFNGRCKKILAAMTEDIRHCAFTADGRLITSGADNELHFSFS